MLNQYFTARYALALSRPGPAGPFLEGFSEALAEDRFAPTTVARYLRAAAHLGWWLETRKLALADLGDGTLNEFIQHLENCSSLNACGRRRLNIREDRAGAVRFLTHLRNHGVAPPAPGKNLPILLEEFEGWMLSQRGLKASTVALYRSTILELLREIGDPANFTLDALRRFVAEHSVRHGPEQAKAVSRKVRSFLRFLAGRGQCAPCLADGIPRIAHWRLASLPAYLPPGDVEKILGVPDPSRPVGLRDRAILLLLARLGLRGGDIVQMRLEDLDWSSGTFAIHGKERRPGRLPLPQEVGDALLEYLAKGRPKVNLEQVFLRVRPPYGPIRSSSSISCLVVAAAERAGVALPPGQRAHVLRHSLATGLVRRGVPVPVIRTVLRHRSDDTTAMYAKVDLPSLLKIARPWPMEAGPC